MQEKLNKIILFILLILIIVFLILFIIDKNNNKQEYIKRVEYFNSTIYIKIYNNSEKKANKILKEIEEIYLNYNKLVDKNTNYNNINNLYYIYNNKSNKEYVTIDKKLYDIILYGKNLYKETNGLIDISTGSTYDIWNNSLSNNKVPTYKQLINKNNINDIILKENKIKNNHVNINLDLIIKGYVNNEIIKYLKNNNINKYLINNDSNIVVGKNYKNQKYLIGIENPDSESDVKMVVQGYNKTFVTKGRYKDDYIINNKRYHNFINPKTLKSNDIKSVTVICDDTVLGDIIGNSLLMLNIEDGKDLLKNYSNVEVIWYKENNSIIKTDNFDKYILNIK